MTTIEHRPAVDEVVETFRSAAFAAAEDLTRIPYDFYDLDYFGWGKRPKANYTRYSRPSWSMPLAALLDTHVEDPVLDVGAAFGHLISDLIYLGHRAYALDCSAFTTQRGQRATESFIRGDGAALPFRDESFGTVISMDFLEHFPETVTVATFLGMDRVLRPEGLQIHLVGCPDRDPTGHYQDPSHQNHQPLTWYRSMFEKCMMGYNGDGRVRYECVPEIEERINTFGLWRSTDWNGRWIVYRKVLTGSIFRT